MPCKIPFQGYYAHAPYVLLLYKCSKSGPLFIIILVSGSIDLMHTTSFQQRSKGGCSLANTVRRAYKSVHRDCFVTVFPLRWRLDNVNA